MSILEAEVDLNTAIRVYRLVRLKYGDAPAACYVELALRKIIAPQCKTQLGRDILGSDRYMDDMLSFTTMLRNCLQLWRTWSIP